MAEIKLDISEYDLLVNKGKLLEEALSREKQWAERVDKLNQERLEAYEKAEKQIVIRKITEKREYLTPSTVSMEQLGMIFSSIRSSGYKYSTLDPAYILSIIENVLRDKSNCITILDEVQTFQGLNEFKIQAEQDAFEKLTKKSKDALEKEPIYDRSIIDNKKLEKINSKLFEENQKLLVKLEEGKEIVSTYLGSISKLNHHLYYVNEGLNTINLFNYKSKIKKIISYLSKIEL